MTTQLAPAPVFRAFDNTGLPLIGGQLFTYVAGSTTPQATYIDSTQTTQNTNPVILNARGEANVWLNTSQTYKLVLTDSVGNLIWSVDQIAGGFVLTAAIIGALLYPQTPAELAASVTPTLYTYPEGDIRRYGALTAATDNSGAINSACNVSAAGGAAAYIPGGTWKIATQVTVTALASIYGAGNSSIILCANAVNGLNLAADTVSYATAGTARFIRDFQIVGTLSGGTNTAIGINCNYTVVSGQQVTGIDFRNVWISNFGTAVYLRQLKNSNFFSIFIYNCYYGIYQNGQTITLAFTDCNLERGSITGSGGGAWGYYFGTTAGESVEDTHIRGGQVYGYDINLNVALAYELQVEHADLSDAQVTCVSIGSTNGGLWIRDCWIELNNASTGVAAVSVGAITPTVTGHVNILDNYISCTSAFAGSIGVTVGNSNDGVKVMGNKIYGFDKGLSIGAAHYSTYKYNAINCVTANYSAATYAVYVTSNSYQDLEVGPNYIVPAASGSASFSAAAMTNASANIGVTNSAGFPVGTPVQFDTATNGAFTQVTYYVVSSAANVITVSATPGGGAISWTGSAALNVFAAPLPLTTAAGVPIGFSFYARGSFIGTATGFTTTVSGPVDWIANGRVVTLNARAATNLSGTSNATTMTLTGIPSLIYPLTTQQFVAYTEDNGVWSYGVGTLSSSGTCNFYKAPGNTAFTASGTKTLNTLAMLYSFT